MSREKPVIKYFKKSPQALFPRRPNQKDDHDLEDPVFKNRHGFNAWWFLSKKRKRDYGGMIRTMMGTNLIDHAVEAFDFAHQMDISD